jgi:hypothetical protein
MLTLKKRFRAPACGPKTTRIEWLLAALAAVLRPFVGCKHGNTTLPYNEHQTCLECGATRQYVYMDHGVFMGLWRDPLPPASTARPQPERDGRAAILNPGADNPLFQRTRPSYPAQADLSLPKITNTTYRIMDRHLTTAKQAVR